MPTMATATVVRDSISFSPTFFLLLYVAKRGIYRYDPLLALLFNCRKNRGCAYSNIRRQGKNGLRYLRKHETVLIHDWFQVFHFPCSIFCSCAKNPLLLKNKTTITSIRNALDSDLKSSTYPSAPMTRIEKNHGRKLCCPSFCSAGLKSF